MIARFAVAVVFASIALGQASHDLSGIWRWSKGVLTMSDAAPQMTPEGRSRFNNNKPSYGPRAIPPALGNDPQGKCDPLGIPRLLFFGPTARIEIVQTTDRMLQFFEWEHIWRTVWTDGRALPNDPDPTYLGTSVGRWQGDTFVVDAAGFDERTWLDHFGDPHSDEMRLQERYRRVDRDTLELTLTLTDPKTYAKPWLSETKTFKLQPKKDELLEIFCIPSQEEEFNKRVRDPAAGKTAR